MSRFDDWLAALANNETSGEYRYDCLYACKAMGFEDPDGLLDLAEHDGKAASNRILKLIIAERDRVSSATLDNRVNAIKQFLGFYELKGNVSWGRIKVAKPKRKKVASDRAPLREELRALLAECDSRMKFYVLASVSSGARRGWTDYANVRDLMAVEYETDKGAIQFGRLVIYRGEAEEYVTFITPEAWQAWLKYRKDREEIGEAIKPDSPLIRDTWENRYYLRGKNNPGKAERVRSKTLGNSLLELWWKAKLPDPSSPNGHRLVRQPNQGEVGEFKSVHGLRKFFETNCTSAGLNSTDIAVLKGSKFSYHKPSIEYLMSQYVKAIPFLTISEVDQLKRENAEMQKRFEEVIGSLEERLNRIELERLKEKVEAKTS